MKKQNVLLVVAAGIVLLSGCASFEEVKNKADAGDAGMQYKMAVMLKEGDGTPADPVKSAEYMEKGTSIYSRIK